MHDPGRSFAGLRIGPLRLQQPAVMGILNVTPDSFSDGGRFADHDSARRQATAMAEAGAAIIDVGGESTRPGAAAVSVVEELDRIIPVVESVRAETGLPVSIDTSKPDVMAAAVAAGARMVNDVRALQEPGALETVASLGCAVCVMHMQGEPRTMQDRPHYDDVCTDVRDWLKTRIEACVAAGIARDAIVADPGFGFGKRREHNVALLAGLRQLAALGVPLLVGLSRKSTLGAITGRGVDGRLPASIAAAVLAVASGAAIVRAHDVAATVDAMKVTAEVLGSRALASVPEAKD